MAAYKSTALLCNYVVEIIAAGARIKRAVAYILPFVVA